MNPYTLYMTYRSPYARKVRIALLEKQIPFIEITLDLHNKPQDFTDLTMGATVPTLVTPDGLIIEDSTLILQYLEETHPEHSLLPKGKIERYQMWNFEEMADRLCDQNVAVFFENLEEAKRQKVFDKASRLTDAIVTQLKNRLEGREYLFSTLSIADIAFACTMNWMSFRLKTDWNALSPVVGTWLTRVNNLESFKQTLPRV